MSSLSWGPRKSPGLQPRAPPLSLRLPFTEHPAPVAELPWVRCAQPGHCWLGAACVSPCSPTQRSGPGGAWRLPWLRGSMFLTARNLQVLFFSPDQPVSSHESGAGCSCPGRHRGLGSQKPPPGCRGRAWPNPPPGSAVHTLDLSLSLSFPSIGVGPGLGVTRPLCVHCHCWTGSVRAAGWGGEWSVSGWGRVSRSGRASRPSPGPCPVITVWGCRVPSCTGRGLQPRGGAASAEWASVLSV